jgi:hypothetical protein
MLDLGEGVRGDQVEKFKAYWLAEIAGKGAMAIIGGSKGAKWLPFRQSNRDMQFTEWQDYLLRKIALVFGLSARRTSTRSPTSTGRTRQVLQENTEDRGLRPLLGNVQDYYTREIVWDKGFGGQDNNLAFAFTKLNQRETLDAAKVQNTQTGGMPSGRSTSCGRRTDLEPSRARESFDKD